MAFVVELRSNAKYTVDATTVHVNEGVLVLNKNASGDIAAFPVEIVRAIYSEELTEKGETPKRSSGGSVASVR